MYNAKFIKLAEKLESDILSGALLPRSKLPGERELAGRFGISHLTANKAVASLVARGLLTRSGRNGTFVAERPRIKKSRMAVVIMSTDTDDHNPLRPILQPKLQAVGFTTVVINPSNPGEAAERLAGIQAPAVVVADSNKLFPFNVLKAVPRSSRLILIGRPDEPVDHPYSTVVLDFKTGSFEAAKALHAFGRKRLTAIVYGRDTSWFSRLYHEGLDQAERELALSPITRVSPDDLPPGRFGELFSGRKRPDGLLAFSDFTATHALKAIAAKRLEVPGDIAVVGYFDTPWAVFFDMTSISIEAEKAAEAVVTLVDAKPGNEMWIKPRLARRGSCPELFKSKAAKETYG